MQMNKPSNYGNQRPHSHSILHQSLPTISFKFNQSHNSNSKKPLPDLADEDEEEFLDCQEDIEDNHEGDDDGDFTFTSSAGQNHSTVPANKPSPMFPLFDQNLLSGYGGNQLPIQPHVDKVFVETPHPAPSSTSEYDEIEGLAVGPYCTWSKQPATDNLELNKKSNSTGFSKFWRPRGKVGRSNSDGRDAFVILKSSDRTSTSAKSVAKRAVIGGSSVKGNVSGGGKAKVVKKGTKVQKENLSAHEVYLRKKEQSENERRRSYLPYRPEIMGFFTNVKGGLSRNVHPF